MGASLAGALGLSELVARSPADYVAGARWGGELTTLGRMDGCRPGGEQTSAPCLEGTAPLS